MKVNIWSVSGYRGFDDYDGPQDDNLHVEVAFDSRFKKEEVLAAFYKAFEKHRTVALSLELKQTIEI